MMPAWARGSIAVVVAAPFAVLGTVMVREWWSPPPVRLLIPRNTVAAYLPVTYWFWDDWARPFVRLPDGEVVKLEPDPAQRARGVPVVGGVCSEASRDSDGLCVGGALERALAAEPLAVHSRSMTPGRARCLCPEFDLPSGYRRPALLPSGLWAASGRRVLLTWRQDLRCRKKGSG
jgi:hypothetical protein